MQNVSIIILLEEKAIHDFVTEIEICESIIKLLSTTILVKFNLMLIKIKFSTLDYSLT